MPEYHYRPIETRFPPVRLSEDPEYGFAVGRVRALEPGLLDRPRYDRLVHAKDGADFSAAMVESGYARFFEGGADVPQALDRAAAEYFGFFTRSVPARDSWLVDLVSLPAHFRQLKIGLKQALVLAGDERQQAVKVALAAFAGPQATRVRGFAATAVARYEEDSDPAAFDTTLDRLEHEIVLETAQPNEFLSGLYGLRADRENLRTFMRVKAASEGDAAAVLRHAFLPGGIVAESVLVGLLDEPCDTAVERLTKSPPFGSGSDIFFDYLEQGSCEEIGRRSMLRMERLGRELELKYLRETRYATFGCEPLVAFYLFQENELRNLRQLYAAKIAGLPPEIVQELVACAS